MAENVRSSGQVAYLVNQYPGTSHTFIRREIAALEAQGLVVRRFSVRRTTAPLVTAADREEAGRTTVLLEQGVLALLAATAVAAWRRPAAFLPALVLALRTGWKSDRGLLVTLIYLAEAALLVRLLEGSGIKHVHAHFGTNSAAVAMLAHALGGPTYSFTVHGPEEFDKPQLLHLREKIARAAFVIGVSDFGRSQLLRQCPTSQWDKVQVVRCGVDASFLSQEPAPVTDLPELVSVGRLTEQKGQLLLMEALAELRRRGRSFRLRLIGDGELRPEIERAIARYDLAECVSLDGWADERIIRARIREARALVLPSFAEGLPVAIMEAFALGRPVISTYVAGIPELIESGKSGWLVPAGSVPELVTALDDVLGASRERLAAMGLTGRAKVLERHHIDAIGRQLATLMQPWVS